MEQEKSQEQIVFENMCLKLATGEYRNMPLNSVGNIVHWLRGLGLIQYDVTQIGWNNSTNNGEVTLYSKIIATYTIDEKNQMPVFKFTNEFKWLNEKQRMYIDGLTKYENPFEQWMKK